MQERHMTLMRQNEDFLLGSIISWTESKYEWSAPVAAMAREQFQAREEGISAPTNLACDSRFAGSVPVEIYLRNFSLVSQYIRVQHKLSVGKRA